MTFFRTQKSASAVALCLTLWSTNRSQAEPATVTLATDSYATRSITLIPFKDPSPTSRHRFRDIDDRPFSPAFAATFRYTNSQVALTYRTKPAQPYFMGYIEARGLKPNFAYQLKLAGKPRDGSRGWGKMGDDRANENLGRVARWWNDTTQQNSNDRDFYAKYENADPSQRQTIYGYIYMGEFVTDANGNATLNFSGAYAYHVAWQDKQSGAHDKLFGDFEIGSYAAIKLPFMDTTNLRQPEGYASGTSGSPAAPTMCVCPLVHTTAVSCSPRKPSIASTPKTGAATGPLSSRRKISIALASLMPTKPTTSFSPSLNRWHRRGFRSGTSR